MADEYWYVDEAFRGWFRSSGLHVSWLMGQTWSNYHPLVSTCFHKGHQVTGLPQVSLRRGVHHVSHLEALDGLVLELEVCGQPIPLEVFGGAF